jgi:hypothetical protein
MGSNMKFQLTLAVVMSLLGNSVQGMEKGEFSLDISGFSRHSKSTYNEDGLAHKYNETNPGIGFSYGLSDNLDLRIGGFENSYRRNSIYVGVNWHKDYYMGDWTVAPGINLLLISGYSRRTDIPVAILPSVTLGHRAVKLSFGLQPFGNESKVATFQLQFNFKYF